jgi:hypothetical protein
MVPDTRQHSYSYFPAFRTLLSDKSGTHAVRLTAKLLLALASTVIIDSEFHMKMTTFYSLSERRAFRTL